MAPSFVSDLVVWCGPTSGVRKARRRPLPDREAIVPTDTDAIMGTVAVAGAETPRRAPRLNHVSDAAQPWHAVPICGSGRC